MTTATLDASFDTTTSSTTAHAPSLVSTRALRKSFGRVEAVSGLDLQVPRHAVYGFLGANGAGKSTSIKLLLGLVRPTSGTASIFGLDVARDGLAIRQRVGYLPQEPRFYNHLTARETLSFAARFFYRGTDAAIARRVDESLALVGLEAVADRKVEGFSGGERQRLGIAAAQINNPELLILDEPAAALDPIGRRDVLDIIMRLRGRATVFFSTHILEDVERVADTVGILRSGRVVAQGSLESLLASGATTFVAHTRGGDPRAAVERLRARSWVRSVEGRVEQGANAILVTVDDEHRAENEILRALLSDDSMTVTHFGRHRTRLEELFLRHAADGDRNGR